MILDQLPDDHRESGRRPTDLEGSARNEADHQSADDARHQSRCRRGSGSDRDSHAERQGYEENNNGSKKVVSEDRTEFESRRSRSQDRLISYSRGFTRT